MSHYTDTHYTDGYKIPITPTEVKLIFTHYTDINYTDIPKRLKGLDFVGKVVKYLLGVSNN